MEDSRKLFGWLARGKDAAVGCSSLLADAMARRMLQFCRTLLFPMHYTSEGIMEVGAIPFLPDASILDKALAG